MSFKALQVPLVISARSLRLSWKAWLQEHKAMSAFRPQASAPKPRPTQHHAPTPRSISGLRQSSTGVRESYTDAEAKDYPPSGVFEGVGGLTDAVVAVTCGGGWASGVLLHESGIVLTVAHALVKGSWVDGGRQSVQGGHAHESQEMQKAVREFSTAGAAWVRNGSPLGAGDGPRGFRAPWLQARGDLLGPTSADGIAEPPLVSRCHQSGLTATAGVAGGAAGPTGSVMPDELRSHSASDCQRERSCSASEINPESALTANDGAGGVGQPKMLPPEPAHLREECKGGASDHFPGSLALRCPPPPPPARTSALQRKPTKMASTNSQNLVARRPDLTPIIEIHPLLFSTSCTRSF
jgi:hypothetical protein